MTKFIGYILLIFVCILVVIMLCDIILCEIEIYKLNKKEKERNKLIDQRKKDIKVGTKLKKIIRYNDPFIKPEMDDIEIIDIKINKNGQLWYAFNHLNKNSYPRETSLASKIIEDFDWEILKDE